MPSTYMRQSYIHVSQKHSSQSLKGCRYITETKIHPVKLISRSLGKYIYRKLSLMSRGHIVSVRNKRDSKDQESIQSSTTTVHDTEWESKKNHIKSLDESVEIVKY